MVCRIFSVGQPSWRIRAKLAPHRLIALLLTAVLAPLAFATDPMPDATLADVADQTADNTPPPLTTPELLTILQAEFAIDRDDTTTGLALYKAESFKENSATVFERALGLSLQFETIDNSLSFAKAWQDSHSDHIPVWFYVTHLALKAGDYATATHNLKLILSYDPKADLSRIFAGILPNDRDVQRELFFALQSIGNDDNPSLSVLKAGLLNQFDEHEAAILYLNKAITAEPNNLAFLTLKADMLQDRGKRTALQQFLQTAQKHTTGETQKQLYLYQIRHLIDHGELKNAWQILKPVQKKFATDHELTLLASLVALDLQHNQTAIDLLSTLTDQPPYQSQAHYYLAVSHERQKKYAAAIWHYQKVDDHELIINARKKIVAYALAQGDSKLAIDTLVDLRTAHPIFASESYTMQADTLIKLGRTDEAKQLLINASLLYPDDMELRYAATLLLDDKDDYTQKLDNIQTLLSFEPDNPRYLLAEARLNLTKDPKHKHALQIATTISQTPLNDPNYDSQLQLEALILLANHDLVEGNFRHVIDRLQTPYDVLPSLAVGTLLLRAYQGLGEHDKVQALIGELTALVGNGKPTPTSQPPTTKKTNP